MPAGSPAADLLTSMTAVQFLHSSVPPAAPEENSELLKDLLENRPILPFIMKLSRMVRESSSAGLIFWSNDGHSLVVLDECSMLPCLEKHYRQKNFVSFVRQLHCHGFTKKTMSTRAVGVGKEGNSNPGKDAGHCITFTHPSCRRDREDLLHLISKKRSVKRSSAAVDDHYSQSDGTVGNKVLISQLYAQARQLFVQHEQLTCSQSSILLRLQGMMRERDLNQQSSAGETVAASTSGGEAPALKRRKRNFDSSDGTF
jgi:hypothetical protein